MTCSYRRKRIASIPDDIARALDDEYRAIERVTDCLRDQIDALPAGWEVTDSDYGNYIFGTSWAPITGLEANTVTNIAAGDRWDFSARIRMSNDGSVSGLVRFGLGIDGAAPVDEGYSISVPANFVGRVGLSGWSLAEQLIPADSTITMWVRESSGNDPQFNPAIAGNISELHYLIISVAAAGGAPNATNLDVTGITTTGLTITSDTGTDAILPAATNTKAGLVTAAQVVAIEAAAPSSRSISTTNGLQGGGDLTANRSLSPVYGSTAGTICQGNDSRLTPVFGTTAGTICQGNDDRLNKAYLYCFNSDVNGTSGTYSTTLDTLDLWTLMASVSGAVNSGFTYSTTTNLWTVANPGVYEISLNFGLIYVADATNHRYIQIGPSRSDSTTSLSRTEVIMLPAGSTSTRFSCTILTPMALGYDYMIRWGKAIQLSATPANTTVTGIRFIAPTMSISRVG